MTELNIPDSLKRLRGLSFPPAIRLDYNNVALEDVLPGLFYITRLGRRRGKGDWDIKDESDPKRKYRPRTAGEVAQELASNPTRFAGFDEDKEIGILEEWLKTSVFRLKERGASDKVLGIRPLHFMTYRVDLPKWNRLINIPEFIAAILHRNSTGDNLVSDPDEPFALQSRKNLLWERFGQGIINESQHFSNAEKDKYDDQVELDIEALLSVRVSELLKPPKEVTVKAGAKGGLIPSLDPLAPRQAKIFRSDFSSFLRGYSSQSIPVRVFGDCVLCLMSLNLTTYFLCHAAALNHLYDSGEWLDDTRTTERNRQWELGIYPDLTGGKNRKSRELAKLSYARHSESMSKQLRAMIGFRLLDFYLRNRQDIAELKNLRNAKGVEQLKLLALGHQPSNHRIYEAVQGVASADLSVLEQEQPDKQWPDDLLTIVQDPSLSPFDRLVELLASTQRNPREQFLKFFISVSRRNLDSGLLAGKSGSSEDNYYTIGTQLLETLVQLLVLDPNKPTNLRNLDIYDFVEQLKVRYGIWIDKPPPGLDTSFEANSAAQANLEALKEKLRQLGFFTAVTDARRMQRLKPRYLPTGADKTTEEKAHHEPMADSTRR